jgi:poly-gamma-glutamate capsule biosynthesis protein CapA/YwtB (metallophosphatase superfamily)
MWLLLAACARTPPPPVGPVHHLAFGGDLCTGKTLNTAIHDPAQAQAMFRDAPPILRDADLALVNSEGVIAGGGRIADRGEPRPILYRARPELIELLRDAGVDVLNLGNNHAGDYGPDALHEQLDRLLVAGMDYVGGGRDAADARTPAYRRVGDTVVAIVGADLTGTTPYAATDDRPGSLVVDPKDAVAAFAPILAEARQHADLVFLTVHWGPNFAKAPTAEVRAVGRALIEAGFDAILGHSAHVPQGVELVDGKPILYDAGNFLAGHQGLGDQAEGLLYDVAFTKAGVTSVTAIPIAQNPGRVEPGTPATLAQWAERSEALGSTVDGATVTCDPGPASPPTAPGDPPQRPVPAEPFRAPFDGWVDAVPPDATPIEARWASGITLIGYHLVAPALKVPKAAQVFDLWFRVDQPQPADLQIEVRGRGRKRDRDLHQPADWALAGDEIVPGRILHDRVLMRILADPVGEVEFSVALISGGRPIAVTADRVDDGAVVLGKAAFDPAAPRIFAYPEMGGSSASSADDGEP